MPISFDHAFGIHDDALVLRGRRAQLLASNLANADTPNYKARDVDFRSALESARAGGASTGVRTTHPRHIATGSPAFAGVKPMYRVPHQPSMDGNTVDTHAEQNRFMDNALRYQASLNFLSGKIRTLQAAMRED